MSEVKWPHQILPRPLGSIVDSQVHLWEKRQEQPADASLEEVTKEANPGQAQSHQPEGKEDPVRHRWLRYWGDAIVAELTRLGHTGESGEAFLNDGMSESPRKEPAPGSPQRRHSHP